MGFFPMMVELGGKPCIVVGGGAVGQRKAEALLDAGAAVTVVSPKLTGGLQAMADEGRLRVVLREYQRGDSDGALLVVAATDQPEVNATVGEHTRGSSAWIDIVDRPELSTFIMPAVVRRGDLLMAVSTSGASPLLARSIRDRLLEEYGSEYAECLRFLRDLRARAKREIPEAGRRQRFLRDAMTGDLHDRIRCGQWKIWSLRVMDELQQIAERSPSESE